MKQFWLILLVIMLIITVTDYNQKQTIAPDCFDDDDCYVKPPKGYCGIDYGCVAGQCLSEPQPCPEICSGFQDEDMDGLVDCKDPDCYKNPYCHCISASYSQCINNKCYCPPGTNPNWIVSDENVCECR